MGLPGEAPVTGGPKNPCGDARKAAWPTSAVGTRRVAKTRGGVVCLLAQLAIHGPVHPRDRGGCRGDASRLDLGRHQRGCNGRPALNWPTAASPGRVNNDVRCNGIAAPRDMRSRARTPGTGGQDGPRAGTRAEAAFARPQSSLPFGASTTASMGIFHRCQPTRMCLCRTCKGVCRLRAVGCRTGAERGSVRHPHWASPLRGARSRGRRR